MRQSYCEISGRSIGSNVIGCETVNRVIKEIDLPERSSENLTTGEQIKQKVSVIPLLPTKRRGLHHTKDEPELKGFADFDNGGCPDTGGSRTGWVLLLLTQVVSTSDGVTMIPSSSCSREFNR